MTATPLVDRAAASRLTRRAGGAGGCNPPAMLAILLARGAGGAAGAGMPRGQARWDGRARRLLDRAGRRRRHPAAGEVGRVP
jgi:hypothetical protein